MPTGHRWAEGAYDVTSLARRLTDYMVLAHDPATPQVAADWWDICQPHYRSVVDALAAATRADPAGVEVVKLADAPTDVVRERGLVTTLTGFLDRRPEVSAQLAGLLAVADPQLLIDYHCGAAYGRSGSAAVTDAGPVLDPPAPPYAAPAAPRAVVVLPFRDQIGGGRARNLVACLASLRAQRRPVHDVGIMVVEVDEQPRWRDAIQPWADYYVFAAHTGPFNKSWTVNVGVQEAPGSPELVCVLDADVLADDLFLERNLARAAQDDAVAFLPYHDMFCLDESSSHAAISSRCVRGESTAALDQLRALVLRQPVGACLWVRAEVFHRIGGMDERYHGWGGEDDDLAARLTQEGRLARYQDPLLHLSHPRPQMTHNGKPWNAHLDPAGWVPGDRYGLLAGPAGVSGSGR